MRASAARRHSLISSTVIIILVAAAAAVSAQTTVPGGAISGTWTAAGSPYLLDGDVNVPAGQTLVIEPGVEVIAQSWYAFTVNGVLQAEGSASQPVVFTEGGAFHRWLGIRFVNSDPGSVLDHCIIERGKATGASPFDKGGGIYIESSSPTISNSTIRDNHAKRSGGGIYMVGSNAVLSNNTITENDAGEGGSASGGGIYIANSNPEITGNQITFNSVYVSGSFSTPTGAGGGLFISNSDPVLRHNLIASNAVNGHLNHNGRGGAVYLYYSDAAFVSCTFASNSSTDEGGAFYSYQSNPIFVNSILWGNQPSQLTASHLGWQSVFTVAYSDLEGGEAGIVSNDNLTVNWLDGNLAADPLFVDAGAGDYGLDQASPAVDAGTDYFAWNGQVLVDLEPGDYAGAAPDMGAFELGGSSSNNQPPVATASASPDHGSAPLEVSFSSAGSYDPDGTIAAYSWSFGDGATSSLADPIHSYAAIGVYAATLTVTDDQGAAHSDTLSIEVVDGTTIWGGAVSGSWTKSGSPYLIENDITVPSGQTLFIEAGVEVLFQSWYSLTVHGVLMAEGSITEPIVFTEGGAYHGWLGIRFVNSDPGSLLSYCTIERGKATGASPLDTGGGIYIESSSPTISKSTIRDNHAKRRGGGIYMTGSNAVLSNNTITANDAGEGGSASGGGVYIIDSNPEIVGNEISFNSVSVSGSFSTPTGAGGGLAILSSDPVLRKNLIVSNSVNGHLNHNGRGGGVYLFYSNAAFVNCSFAANSSTDEGGALYSYQSNPVFVNSILWGDTPSELTASHLGWQSVFTVAYSDVEGGEAAIVSNSNATINWLQGNLETDPLFVNPNAGDYSLDAGSPAVDAGTDSFAWNGQVLVDLGPDDYSGTAPDMGAFELAQNDAPNQPPVVVVSVVPGPDLSPMKLCFSSAGSYDPDGTVTAYAWDFGDGQRSTAADPSHRYRRPGIYPVKLTITDDDGASTSASLQVRVGVESIGSIAADLDRSSSTP